MVYISQNYITINEKHGSIETHLLYYEKTNVFLKKKKKK